MKKSVLAMVLAASLFLTGCSGGAQEESNTSPIESTDNSNVPKNDEQKEKFAEKCKEQIEQMKQLFSAYPNGEFQIDESSIQYAEDDIYSSKIYVFKGGNNNDERFLMCYLDIYSTDEYEFFQVTKEFISFIEENALDIAGRNEFMISINPQDNGVANIGIIYQKNGTTITYADRHIRSAYSDRLKSMDLFKECSEQISISGLIKYDDLPSDHKSYDVTCEYDGKQLTHKWYKIDDGTLGNVFVTYIDDGSYDDITDEELIYYAYFSAFDPNNIDDSEMINDYYFAYKSGENIVCSIHYMNIFNKLNSFSCNWNDKYEYLNDNEFNISLKNSIIEQIGQ